MNYTDTQTVATMRTAQCKRAMRTYDFFRMEPAQKRGHKLLTFKAYVHPYKTAGENRALLEEQRTVIYEKFSGNRVVIPSTAEIERLNKGREALTKAVINAGSIAEKFMPKASQTWFDALA